MDGARLAYGFALGMLATVNPCGFALLPAYLSYYLGLTDDAPSRSNDTDDTNAPGVARALSVSAAMTLGFLAVFTPIGLLWQGVATSAGGALPWITIVLGVVVFAVGIAMLRGYEPVVRLPKLAVGKGGLQHLQRGGRVIRHAADNPRGGGALVDLHIHDVDFVNYCFGKPDKIEAAGVNLPGEGVGDILALYTYQGGPVVTLHGAWNYMPKFPFRMAFNMSLENASFEFNSMVDMNLHVYPKEGGELVPELESADGYLLEEKYFLECIDKGVKPSIVTPEAALESVVLAEQELAAMA